MKKWTVIQTNNRNLGGVMTEHSLQYWRLMKKESKREVYELLLIQFLSCREAFHSESAWPIIGMESPMASFMSKLVQFLPQTP